jgi:hypothetical protein
MTTTTIKASFDSYVRQDQSDTNFGDETVLRMRTDSGENRFAFVYFPIALPTGATILSATLTLKRQAAWSGTHITTASRVTATWKEARVTYTNRPSVTATNEATLETVDGALNSSFDLDVTDIVQDWVDGQAVYGLRLETDHTSALSVYSSEAADARRPTLVIEYAVAPQVPTNLRPAGAQAVALEEPLLIWDGPTPTQVRLQIDSVSTFDSGPSSEPEWDSDWVDHPQTSYDTLDDSSPPLLVSGSTYYWRVQWEDENGVQSEWSEAAEFSYYSQGTLTITTPAADDDDVETTTPLVAHTLTGRTQAFTQHLLYADDVLVYEGPVLANTDTSNELPSGYITSDSVDYTVVVRTWDNISRSGAGAVTYVEEERVFQFITDATVDPVTNLDVTQADGHVHIAWQRAVEPDYFAIVADGEIVVDRLDASDLFVSGTSYAYDYYAATPHTAVTYEVWAGVLASGTVTYSDVNPTDALTFRPVGIWLVDTTAEVEVHLLGNERVSSVVGESAAVFFPLNRRDPVRIVDTVRGYEGSASGTLVDWDVNAETSKASLDNLLSDPSHDLRLVYGRRNLPVIVGDFDIELLNFPEEAYGVSFDYWQVGEFDVEQN